MSLTEKRDYYKPFEYPWAFEVFKEQNKMHWLPEESPLQDDVKDFINMPEDVRNLLIQIFRFFTQQDVDVGAGYIEMFGPYFKPVEIRQMISAIANMEGVHMFAYSELLETLGLPESEYKLFSQIKSMSEKHEYLSNFNMDTPHEVAKSIAIYSAMTEGVQLFSSFAILLNFTRFNLMKGMGQIVTWSIRDESLHVQAMSKLFKTFIAENPELMTDKLKMEIYSAAERVVELEDHFIDTCFGTAVIPGISADEVKYFIRYLANRRLRGIDLKGIFVGYDVNPFDWLEELLNSVEHANFFETRSTEYNKAATSGNWGDVFK